jgi:hypothetical protein
MIKTENRTVEVKICDLCGEETQYISKCAACKRDMCNEKGNTKHCAYSLEIYRYSDGERTNSTTGGICKECIGKKTDLTLKQLFDALMSDKPVPTLPDEKHERDWLSEILVDLNFVTAKQIIGAFEDAKPGQNITDVLLEKKHVTPAQVLMAKAAKYGAEIIALGKTEIDLKLISLLQPKSAWSHRVIPVAQNGTHTTVAMEDPTDLDTIDALVYVFKTEIKVCIVAEDDMEAALKKYYPEGEETGRKLHATLKAQKG